MPASSVPKLIADDPTYQAIHSTRERAAQAARNAQGAFRANTAGFIAATACAAILGGLILYGTDPSPNADAATVATIAQPWVRLGLGIGEIVALGCAVYCGVFLNQGKFGRTWLQNRLKAEAGRSALYRRTLEVGHAGGQAPFEEAKTYVLTAFLDGQIQYLESAAKKHDRRGLTLIVISAGVSAIGVVAGAIAGLQTDSLAVVAAFFGIMVPAAMAALKAWADASRDPDRARLHNNTLDQLISLRGDRAVLDEAVAAGDLPAALAYTDRIIEALRIDHEAFADLMKAVEEDVTVPSGPAR